MNVSLIIPVYNAETMIVGCLRSVRRQRRLPDEILLVDNNSTDRSVAMIQNYHRHYPHLPIRVLQESRQGAAAARNCALREACGELIAMTDADCVLDRDWLEHIVEEFEKDPQLDALGGALTMLRHRSTLDKMQALNAGLPQHLHGQGIFRKVDILFGKSILTGNAAYKRYVLQELRGFDVSYERAGEDVDLCLRAFEHGFRLRVWCPHIHMRHTPRNNWKSFFKQMFEYRSAVPRLIRNHFQKRVIIQLPNNTIIDSPFFVRMVVTREFIIVMMLALLVLLGLITLGVSWRFALGMMVGAFLCRWFWSIKKNSQSLQIKTSFAEACLMTFWGIVLKCVTQWGRIYGGLKHRLIYL